MKHFIKFWAVLFISILFLLVGKAEVTAAPPTNFQTTQVIGAGLDGPSGFAIAPDGRIFVLEREGKIKIVKNGVLLPTPFADLPSAASGDRGLIGIAFDPEFAITNSYVYFYYTGTDLLNRVVRFDASEDIGTNGPFVLYQTTSPSQELHVGGSVQFGPDGKLYFAVGDNGYPPNAQNLGNPHGKILRINKDGSIPLDNPFFGQTGALPEIWAYGMRNPWRFQFDSQTGLMYGADVGDFTWEEVNNIRKGQNYGWPTIEGPCTTICGNSINPIYAYNHDGESKAVTGGPVYRGTMFPAEYRGNLFIGDYAQGFIKRIGLNADGNATGVQDFDLNAGSVVDLKVATDGSLYYITYYPGRLYKVTYNPDNQSPTANATADKTKGLNPLTVNFSSAGSTDPDGDPITYLWKLGDGTTSTVANPVKTYANKGTYTVDLAVSDGTNTSNSVPLVIQVGTPPNVNISTPADGSTYRAGDTVTYNVFASDGAGFDVNDASIKTEVYLHHGTHTHPLFGPFTGRVGTFTIPTTGEPSANTKHEIRATVTDTNGLSTTKSNFIVPVTTTYTLQTQPAGLTILLDGVPRTTPTAIEGVEGFKRELSAPTIQEINGTFYQFEGWSDGGAPRHMITTPEANTTYTAVFSQAPAYNAEYFNNPELAGAPVLTRQDAKIDFLWADGSPDPLINTDNFSARWTKNQYFAAGRYKFVTATDDGVRVFIDGNPVINEFHGGNASYNATVDLTAGVHEIRMEYLEQFGLANARLDYELTPDQPVQQQGGFVAQYYNNKTLTGAPVLTRNEAVVNNNWGDQSPDPVVNADNFSARWTKTETFVGGVYEFTTTADDGVRIIIDGEIIINKFIDQAPTTYKATKTLSSGNHTIVMEYYENAGGAQAALSYVKTGDVPAEAGFTGEYFNNKTLAGAPVLTRNDATVNFDWASGSPAPVVNVDNFSARWTKNESMTTATAGNYEFTVTADDGVRVKVDGELLIDKFIDQGPTTYKATKALAAGNHTIIVEYYENGGGAMAKFSYVKVNTTPPPAGAFVGEYFANTTLAGAPILTRNDATINFDWAAGSPDPLVPNNNFSARWTKTQTFTAGAYEFSVTGDDGIRLKIDGVTVIDKFIDQGATTYKVVKDMTAGDHIIIVEYYEAGGDATAKFSYAATTVTPPTTTGFNAEYFNNKDLLAPVTLTRTDAAINFDWAGGSPDPLINANNFSARWTKTENFVEAGDYKFTVTADDGIRLKLDGVVIIDKFIDQGPTTYDVTKTVTAGNHTIVVEYYENGGGATAKFSYAKVAGGVVPPAGNGCPTDWICQDIGATGQAGSSAFANNEYTLKGSGWDVWGTDDMFHFASKAITGDATIIARVTSQTNTNPWAKAGVMIKESNTIASKYVAMAVTPDNGYRMQYNFTGEVNGGAYTFPNAWVKLTRGGNVFTTYKSVDGVTWNQVGTTNLAMNADARIGLFVTSHDNNVLCTVTFDNVSITPGVN